jgi:predicted ArsR family transcriptional regulator
MHNCPFHALVSEHKELVCGMNLALLEGVVEGLELPGVKPVPDAKPGMCRVTLRLKARRA